MFNEESIYQKMTLYIIYMIKNLRDIERSYCVSYQLHEDPDFVYLAILVLRLIGTVAGLSGYILILVNTQIDSPPLFFYTTLLVFLPTSPPCLPV